MTLARLRLVLGVHRRRLRDRWRERRTGRRRRWDVALPPAGAPPGVAYVLLRGTSAPIPRPLAGDEYAPAPEPPPIWARSDFWTRREREPGSPYDWRPAPPRPSSLPRLGR